MIKSISFRIVFAMNALTFLSLDLLLYVIVIVIVNTTERSFNLDSSV